MQIQSQTVTVFGVAKAPACFWSDGIRLKIILEQNQRRRLAPSGWSAVALQSDAITMPATRLSMVGEFTHLRGISNNRELFLWLAGEGGLCAPEVIRSTETDAQWQPAAGKYNTAFQRARYETGRSGWDGDGVDGSETTVGKRAELWMEWATGQEQ